LNESLHQTTAKETSMKRSPDSNSLPSEQPTKKERLSESNEEEVIFVAVSSTSESNRPTALQNTEGFITRLPNELLECILLKLSYDEISKVRQVCRRFRDVGSVVLNREFCNLKNCVDSHLADVVKEENALLGNHLQSWSGSTRRAECNSIDGKTPSSVLQKLTLIRCRGLLQRIGAQIRLMRAVSYRLLFLSDVHPNLCCSGAFFAGNIIDEIHRILRIIRMRRVVTEIMAEPQFYALVHKWIIFFLRKIERQLIRRMCSLSQSACPDLLGSKVIDLLECFLNCKKDTSFNIDSEGWCYMKGVYKLPRIFFGCKSERDSELTSLTVRELMNLHEVLYRLATASNDFHIVEEQAEDENALHINNTFWVVSGSYQVLGISSKCGYSFAHYSKRTYREMLQTDNEYNKGRNRAMDNVQHHNNCINIPSDDEEDFDLMFKVDMKCRKEFAPIEAYLEFLKKSSYDEDEDGTETPVYTVQDSSPGFTLKLEIESRPDIRDDINSPAVYKYLIQQSHIHQEGSEVHAIRTS
jgi:hypothetical protein